MYRTTGFVALWLVLLMGCDPPTRTGEFGVSYRAMIEGRVVGASAQALDSVEVRVHLPAGMSMEIDTPPSMLTDRDGSVAFPLICSGPCAQSPPDSLQFYMVATARPPTYAHEVSDSVRVTVRFAPMTEDAPVATAELILPIS